ncbi:pyridoxal-phosphate dependent enzyme [Deinococcus cavernae]|nr:pyridoxal-phosphate dependent enzyme [Deinococcus cavernae]
MTSPDLRPILTVPHPVLREKALPVSFNEPELAVEVAALHAALNDFRERMGFGRAIAAPQIGILKRLIALNLGAGPVTIINPEIFWRSDEQFEVWDDCLSIPDVVVRVKRHTSISLTYQDEQGRKREWINLPPDLSELLQHEIDHLDGILMTDRAHGPDALQPMARHAELVGEGRPRHRLSLENIRQSAGVIDPVFLNSPQFNCEPLSAALGCELTLKLEFTNPIRSFKGRGASYLIRQLTAQGDHRLVVCGSAGNFGQAMAYACRAAERDIVIFASVNANPLKVERMRLLGAEVRQAGEDFDAAKEAAQAFAHQTGALMIEDGRQEAVSEGHGTIGLELLKQAGLYDAITIPLGNGALLNGVGRWFKAASPATRVVGVSASGASAMRESWQTGQLVQPQSVNTIADGIAVRVPIPEAVADMQGSVDSVLLVDDSHLIQAMQLLYRHGGLLVEPSGAAGVAALLAYPEQFQGKKVATLLCGSNLTETQIREWILN